MPSPNFNYLDVGLLVLVVIQSLKREHLERVIMSLHAKPWRNRSQTNLVEDRAHYWSITVKEL